MTTITGGNQPSGQYGGAAYNLSAEGVLTHELTLDEQGNHNIPLLMTSGETVIGGCDATDDWTAGNVYVKSDGVWTKKRTLENVIHVFGICEHNGKLYVGTGAHIGDNATWEARVYWSDDLGDTWDYSYVCYYRVRDLISFSGDLYASCWDWPNYNMYKSSDDGATWEYMPDFSQEPLFRMAVYNGKLLVIDQNRTTIHCIGANSIDTPLTSPLPFALIQSCTNYMVAIGTDLYVLLNGNKVYHYDGTDWTYHCDLGEACCSLLNFDDQFLIASTMGVDAKILKIPLAAS